MNSLANSIMLRNASNRALPLRASVSTQSVTSSRLFRSSAYPTSWVSQKIRSSSVGRRKDRPLSTFAPPPQLFHENEFLSSFPEPQPLVAVAYDYDYEEDEHEEGVQASDGDEFRIPPARRSQDAKIEKTDVNRRAVEHYDVFQPVRKNATRTQNLRDRAILVEKSSSIFTVRASAAPGEGRGSIPSTDNGKPYPPPSSIETSQAQYHRKSGSGGGRGTGRHRCPKCGTTVTFRCDFEDNTFYCASCSGWFVANPDAIDAAAMTATKGSGKYGELSVHEEFLVKQNGGTNTGTEPEILMRHVSDNYFKLRITIY